MKKLTNALIVMLLVVLPLWASGYATSTIDKDSLLVSDSTLSKSFNIWYVKKGGNGNGSSWRVAFSDLQDALEKSKPGDQIWVAQGTYFPTLDDDREVAFEIKSDIQLYGGFRGNEKKLEERDWKKYSCILSGAIGEASTADNSFNVVRFKNASANTILDGFTIERGEANAEIMPEQQVMSQGLSAPSTESYGTQITTKGRDLANSIKVKDQLKLGRTVKESIKLMFEQSQTGQSVESLMQAYEKGPEVNTNNSCGAGIFNLADSLSSSPKIRNCRLVKNAAFYGAAVFNYSKNGGTTQPVMENCKFSGNIAQLDGGAIYNSAKAGRVELLVKNSTFSRNAANYGAVVFTDFSDDCKSVPKLINCKFVENAALTRGKVHYDNFSGSFCSTQLRDCQYDSNMAGISARSQAIEGLFGRD